ncbi:iron ABC transporter permease [Yimella sp. cx-51]|nr:iron ABC transporter permease [Yimella sp. cx-51]MBC9956556.1 iron ABC transporter permease [Yimella sp. cx-51]QTH39443.1 iron ABC transporter permease [Yimella sp. cx-51]
MAARLLLGDFTITIPDFFRIITGTDIPVASFIVMESKLPAALAGALAGIAFGAAGSIFQTMLRNPLASPDVLGVTLGASVGALGSSILFGWSGTSMSLAALVGGLAVAVLIHVVGGKGETASHRMILIGLGIAAALQSLIQWLLTRTSVYQAQDAMIWLTGSLNAPVWDGITRLALVVAVCLPIAMALGRGLRLLELGHDAATGLGANVHRTRLALMGIGVLMTATAASVTGPIAFVSLLAGPIARRINAGRPSILLSAIVGACVVVGADYLASYVIPGDLPVGVLTGIAGAPFLLYLLVSTRRSVNG